MKHLIVLIQKRSKKQNLHEIRKAVHLMKYAGHKVDWSAKTFLCFDVEENRIVGLNSLDGYQVQWAKNAHDFRNKSHQPDYLQTDGTVLTTKDITELRLKLNPEPLQ